MCLQLACSHIHVLVSKSPGQGSLSFTANCMQGFFDSAHSSISFGLHAFDDIFVHLGHSCLMRCSHGKLLCVGARRSLTLPGSFTL